MYLLYDLLLLIAAVILVPYYLLRGYRYGKSRRGIRERLGYLSDAQLQQFQGRKIIWIHAVSVGETRAAEPLLKELRQQHPEHLILVTNVTETGRAMALANQDVDCCLFFPFDFSWTVRRVLQIVNPDLVVIVETEIWPNFVRQAKKLEIPLVLVNGRISDRSYPRYRFFRPLLRSILQCFSAFCMQSQLDSERIGQLGAESLRVENTGNLKFDHELRDIASEEIVNLKRTFCLPDELPILVAGSTHSGEEEQLVGVYKALLGQGRQLLLLLIPRHPERCREVQAMLTENGIESRLRSGLEDGAACLESGQVLLVDTLGEVLNLYAVSDLVFVGGSLVPIGGHNLLEASLLGKPVLFGPHIQNFREISKKLIRAGAGVKVMNLQELERHCILMLDDPIRCRAMGQAGRSLIAENAGATERTMRRISRFVKS
ncbi:3-deoxy-D-manno-octulosonic acid transferase [Deltaproteobacteria bacterium]|nr:3-deoxy-D-manno-octulosonic acid transferase [Deltaproteobacteria bacterium]